MAVNCELLLLGPAEIRLENLNVRVRQWNWRALLFFLASHGGMVSQEDVFPLFWEGYPREALHHHLKRAQAGLRSNFSGLDIIRIDDPFVGLNFSQIYIDQHEFQNLVDNAGGSPWQLPPQAPLTPEAYDLLSAAAALWRGPRFLEGASFPLSPRLQKWFQATARKLETLRGRILERLANHHRASENLELALHFARQALENLPISEDLHFLVIQTLVDLNRIEEARLHFVNLQNIMQRELDTAPSPRLVELYRRIRTGTIRHSHPPPTNRLKIRPGPQYPFVMRGEILESFKQKLQKGGGLFIIGDSGQGKTRLLQELSLRSVPQARMLVATCHPAGTNLPFQPIIEILRNDLLPDEWLSMPSSLVSQLTLLIPELALMRPDLARPLVEVSTGFAPDHARSILMEAIRQVFLHLASGHRLVFCMDDAHWSDEATLATIPYLLEREPFTRDALMVATARQDEKNPQVAALLNVLTRDEKIQVIQLPPFSPNETAELVRHVMGVSPSNQFSRRLAQETGGNPLFILETLQLIKERNAAPDLNRIGRLPVGDSLQALLKTRLAKLSPAEREVIEAAAVLGDNFDPEIAAQALGISSETLWSALNKLEELRLVKLKIEASGSDQVKYSLIHHYLQEVLLQEINPLYQKHLHLRIAQLLKERLRSTVSEGAAILAQHYEAAGEPSLAFDQWVEAGLYARQLFSTADAYSAFRRAEKLIGTTPGLTDEQIHRLYDEWTETAFINEDPASIRRLNNDLLKIGEQRRSPLLIGAALDGLSDACMAENQFKAGLEFSERAIRFLEKSGNLFAQMEAYNHRGVFLYMLNQIEAACEAFQDALALGAQLEDPNILQPRADAHYQIAFTSILKGWPGMARLNATRSLEICKGIKQTHGQIAALSALALASYFLGDFSYALEACEEGIELAARMQAWRMYGYLHTYQAMLLIESGQIDRGLQALQIAHEQGERFGHQEISAFCHRLHGDLYFLLGDTYQSYQEYRQALELSENLFLASDSRFRVGIALCLKGELEKGQLAIEHAVKEAESSAIQLIYLLARQALTYTEPAKQNPEFARQITAETLQETSLRGLKGIHLWTLVKMGEIHLQQQEYGQARELLTSTAQEASKMNNPWIELSALNLQTRLALLNGEDAEPFQQRIKVVLSRISNNLTQEPYRQAFLRFQEQLIKQ